MLSCEPKMVGEIIKFEKSEKKKAENRIILHENGGMLETLSR